LESEHLVLPMARNGGYRLGPGVLRLTTSTYAHLAAAMRPALVGLASGIDDNVDLAVLSGGEVIVVDQISSSQRLQAVTEVGGIFPAHASCVGKVLLANLSDPEIGELLATPLTRYTPNTLTEPDALLADIDRTRRNGISYDREEHDIGISAVATSVRSPMGIMQAVSIVAPTHRFETAATTMSPHSWNCDTSSRTRRARPLPSHFGANSWESPRTAMHVNRYCPA